MPTAYIKKLAKLNHTTVNKIEKFWAQAKEIAKSEGQGKAWGLITSIFQNKLKKEGYKVKAFKEETLEIDDREFIFKRLSLSDCVKQIKDLFYDYFNFGKKDPEYYKKLYNTKVDESTASDLLTSDDFTVYIEYNDGSKWYSVDNPKLKDLKLTGIKNCIIEYPAYTAYFGKDCRIERFDDAEDAPYVIKCEAKMNKYAYKGEIITASSKDEAITKIISSKQPKMERVVARNKKHLWELIDDAIDKYGDNCDLNFIDVSNVKDMSYLFERYDFDGDISKWDVSNVTNMEDMFNYSEFNGDISKWDVSKVKNMTGMFSESKFNKDISKWNVSNVEKMDWMFYHSKFNKDISKWNVSNVKNMGDMFSESRFNGDISKWNVSNVKDMSYMFWKSKFTGDISKWLPMMKKKKNYVRHLGLPKKLEAKLEKEYEEL